MIERGRSSINASSLPQWAHVQLVQSTTGGVRSRLSRAAAALVRRGLINWRDPPIHYQFEGTTLLLPLSHELPYYRSRFPDYSRNVGRIAARLHAKRGNSLMIIDVGANVGDTLAIIRSQVPSPVLCIEPHPAFAKLLRENAKRLGPAVIEQTLLGHSSETVPPLTSALGTASIGKNDKKAGLTTEPLPSVLARHPPFEQARLVKIDADGYDGEILRGAARWLEHQKPVLFFEHDPHLEEMVTGRSTAPLDLLAEWGYQYISVFSNEGNHVVSSESLEASFLREILHYFSGRQERRYCDIAAYAENDGDVWADVRDAELRRA